MNYLATSVGAYEVERKLGRGRELSEWRWSKHINLGHGATRLQASLLENGTTLEPMYMYVALQYAMQSQRRS